MVAEEIPVAVVVLPSSAVVSCSWVELVVAVVVVAVVVVAVVVVVGGTVYMQKESP